MLNFRGNICFEELRAKKRGFGNDIKSVYPNDSTLQTKQED